MHSPRQNVVNVLLVVAAITALVYFVITKFSQDIETPLASKIKTAAGVTIPIETNTASIDARVITKAILDSRITYASTVESKSALVDGLTKSGRPDDAFKAYRVLLDCTQRTICGDITPGQRTTAYNLLKIAVQGEVSGAAVYLLNTTPDGRPLNEVWNDPAYGTWKSDALTEIDKAAVRGDPLALRQMAELSLQNNDPEKALTYWTAYVDRAPESVKAGLEQISLDYKNMVRPDRIPVILAEGHSMVNKK